MDYEATLPSIRIAQTDLEEILSVAARSRGIFSCNDRCEVWLSLRRGHIPPAEREYVDLASLDEIAEAVVHACPGGGRFRVTSAGVFLVKGNEQIFTFDVV